MNEQTGKRLLKRLLQSIQEDDDLLTSGARLIGGKKAVEKIEHLRSKEFSQKVENFGKLLFQEDDDGR